MYKLAVAFRPPTLLATPTTTADQPPPVVSVYSITVDLCEPFTKEVTSDHWLSIADAALSLFNATIMIFDFKNANAAEKFLTVNHAAAQLLHDAGKLMCIYGPRNQKKEKKYSPSNNSDVVSGMNSLCFYHAKWIWRQITRDT